MKIVVTNTSGISISNLQFFAIKIPDDNATLLLESIMTNFKSLCLTSLEVEIFIQVKYFNTTTKLDDNTIFKISDNSNRNQSKRIEVK